MEFGAGTGILSFLLRDCFREITLVAGSPEMIKVCEEKIDFHRSNHIRACRLNLELSDHPSRYDLIYSQMVLHHVRDVEKMMKEFSSLLNPGGYLAIADLFTEDGSFHGPEVQVHRGFDPERIIEMAKNSGFQAAVSSPCFEITRDNGRIYPLFLLVAKKPEGSGAYLN